MAGSISAIISGYFAANFLGDRLDNLRRQTIPVEIILICQYGSAEAEFYGQVDCCIYTKDIPGLYTAWNKGVRFASGEYITNANADDLLVTDGLAILVDALEMGPYDLAYGDHINSKTGDRVYRPNYSLDDIRRHCWIGPFPMWRKSLHDRFGYFDESFLVAGDWEFWNRCAGPENYIRVPKIIGTYNDRSNSLEKRLPESAAAERSRILEAYAKGD